MSQIEYRKYFGKKFWREKGGYWVNGMPIHAQRWVWINHHGAIPKGMDIHHKDGDKGNNEIENLEMMSRSDHLKRHWQEGRFDLDQRRSNLPKQESGFKQKKEEKNRVQSLRRCGKKEKNLRSIAKNAGRSLRLLNPGQNAAPITAPCACEEELSN